jgi:hypothetical protein
MVLILNHFDTKIKQDTQIHEQLENTLAEYLFPGVEFSIGTAYSEATVPQDLEEYRGMSLQFSAGKRMFFANDEIRDSLYPNPSDGAAYPLPFTPCRTFHVLQNVRVLVIDDVTGENGGIIANTDAKKLVGDCKGLIDIDFATSNNIEPHPFQFRLGIKPQAESPVMRIAKGTLAPQRLDKLGESFFRMGGNVRDDTLRSKIGYDMVVATSSFKGRKGEDAIQPGEYMLSIGLGVKALALYRQHSLGTQILVNYPLSVEREILPIIKKQALALAHDQKNLRRLALRYIQTYEHRKAKLLDSNQLENCQEELDDKFSVFDDIDSGGEGEQAIDGENYTYLEKDSKTYLLLKADLDGYCQLLEHPKIIAELQEFARKQWLEIATGRSIKFTSGLAQPSLDLKCDEICIPYLGSGEEIIVTRSPLINSNGVITLKNKHLPQMLDGCVYIHPKTAMNNMQCDFDGDLLAFAPSREFPHLASEVKEKNLPQNRYPDIVKKDKVPYRGTFAEIAVSAMENKIGIIANEIQKNIGLQCEICAMPTVEKSNYLQRVSAHCSFLAKRCLQGKLQIPGNILDQINKIAETGVNIKTLDGNQIEEKLQLVKKLLFDCVAELGNELQVATDGPKSALRPSNAVIQYCQAITAYKEVDWLADKKNPEAFTNKGMKTNGYSPIDSMIQQTNQIFEQHQLNARPIEQFKKLYPGIAFSPAQKQQAQKIKLDYNSLIKKRLEIEERNKSEPGPFVIITSLTSGKQLEITNLIRCKAAKNPDFWKATELSIQLVSRQPTPKMPHSLFAQVKFITPSGEESYVSIGTISLKSMQENNLKPGMTIDNGKVEFYCGASDSIIDALKQETKEFTESVKNNTPETERLQLQAAIHNITHTEESKNYPGLKKAGVAFAVFPEEVVNQLQNLQFTDMRVIGAQFNECAGINFRGEQLVIKFEDGINPRDPTKTARWVTVEGKKLGTIDARSPHLLAGCEANATITSSPATSVIVTSLKNPSNKLQIDNVNKYTLATRQWQGEQANITLSVRQTDPRKAPSVFAKLGNQVLGVLNKQSVTFLEQQLATKGRTIQGLTIMGTINNTPASYADIAIDPSSVKLPVEIKSDVCTVLFFEAHTDTAFQAKTEQVMCNMLKRAVERAMENGYGTVQFIDISPHKSDGASKFVMTIQQLAAEPKNIKVEFIGTDTVERAIKSLTKLDDIVLGVRTQETIGIIDYVAHQGKAIAAYIPETGGFNKWNLPLAEKTSAATKNNAGRER